MEDHLQAALDKSDLAALEKGLTQAARFAPDPSWENADNGWTKLSKAGATAAASGDLATVKQTCKSCHKAWRSKYKQPALRSRPIP
jgi:hypothetical protein